MYYNETCVLHIFHQKGTFTFTSGEQNEGGKSRKENLQNYRKQRVIRKAH